MEKLKLYIKKILLGLIKIFNINSEFEDLLKNENKKLKKEIELLTENFDMLKIKNDELQKNYNYVICQQQNINKFNLIFEKDFYGILNADLSIKNEYLDYFIRCDYKYYLVLGFPFTYENKEEIQEKVFRDYLKGFRERNGKNKITMQYDNQIKYIWTREKGKMNRTHYNLLINNSYEITSVKIKFEIKKWYDLLLKNSLVNKKDLWNDKMYYIAKIYSLNNFLNSNNKSYIFKEFNIEKTEFEKNINFIGLDLETKKYLEEQKKLYVQNINETTGI